MIRTLLVDDEPLAIEGLRDLLAAEPDVEVSGVCFNGQEAVSAIRALRPDLVLLDVQMPVLDGFEVLEELEPEEVPLVIFVTAYDQYSVRAFAVHAVDFLLKPVDPERFRDALRHARGVLASREERETNRRLLALLGDIEERRPTLDRFVVRDRDRVRFIKAQEVEAIEAAGVYAVLHRGQDVFVLRDGAVIPGGPPRPEPVPPRSPVLARQRQPGRRDPRRGRGAGGVAADGRSRRSGQSPPPFGRRRSSARLNGRPRF